jgi:ATP-dependent RNA helicase SUPV3L1/SUV3
MRRMRENTMLETEITKTGEVVVEGHTIGRLDGFRFAPDLTSGGTDAKALSAAAQKALSGEIETRANKLAHAPDSQFVLTSDATIRWIGEPVAKVLPGDAVLRPRVRILADEQLTGAALEAAQTRLDLWLRTHVERLLAPLFVLSAAEDITGIGRGIAYQVVESLGVLERSKVADDLKTLDQAARAVLRKHGIRFGAYHVYVPLLLKPAPRTLAAQLWALKHGGPDTKGLDDLQRLAASGRTSFPVDKDVLRTFYRTIGYRVCGERAVRVDILERLADLIRPALAWRPSSPAPQPAGAYEGIGFTVTQAMTSLTGSSGEDFASILRALGYRMEKKPKLAAAEPAAAEPGKTAEPAAGTETAATAEMQIVPEGAAADADQPAAGHEPAADAIAETGAEAAPAQIAGEIVAGSIAAGRDTAAEDHGAADEGGAAAEASAPKDAPESNTPELPAAASADPQAPAEPEMVEVWRPGGRSDERRSQRRPGQWQRGHQSHGEAQAKAPGAGAESAAASEGSGETVTEAADAPAEKKGGQHRRPRGQQGEFGRHRDNGGERRPREHRAEHHSERQGDHRQGDQRQGRDRPDRSRGDRPSIGKGRGDYKDRRDFTPHREREKQADPNSPFAKLAALKAQLEAAAKERR